MVDNRTDLDQSGHGYHRARTYLGPSLGWVDELVEPATQVVQPGTYTVKPGDSLLLVAVPAGVTIQLPDVKTWVAQKSYQPGTAFDRSITVKDIGSFANVGNILVKPLGFDQIDMRQQPVAITLAGATVRFVPLIDVLGAAGWAMEAAWGLSTPVGGGDVFKNLNNTFTGINIFTNVTEGLTPDITESSGQFATTEFVNNFWLAKVDDFVVKNPAVNQFIHGVNTFDGRLEAVTPDITESTGIVATTEFVHNVVLAFDAPLGTVRYGRQNGNWVNLDAVYFPNTGGTITGGVAIHAPSPVLTLFPTAPNQSVGIFGTNSGQMARWGIELNDGSGESGSNTGSNFAIDRFNDAGSFIDRVLTINRQSGQISVGAALNLPGDPVNPNQAATKAYVDAHSGGGGGSGNVSNVGTPVALQYARWTDATHIEARNPSQVLSDIGAQGSDSTLTALAGFNSNGIMVQTATDTFTARAIAGPLNGVVVTNGDGIAGNPTIALADDLAALEALTGTNNIYYRSGTSTWTAVTIGANLTFSGGTLSASTGGGGTGNVSNVGTPTNGQWAQWTDDTHIRGIDTASTPWLQRAGGTMTGQLTVQSNIAIVNPSSAANFSLQAAAGFAAQIVGKNPAGTNRWLIQLPDGGTESGGNTGSDFAIWRYNDGGTTIDAPIQIIRSTGELTLTHNLNLPGNPGSALQAAPKQYVDSAAAARGDAFLANVQTFVGVNSFTATGMSISPVAGLKSGGNHGRLEIDSTTSQQQISLTQWSADTAGAKLSLRKSRGVTAGSNVVVAANDILGQIQFWGNTGSGFSTIGYEIKNTIDEAPFGSNIGSHLGFYTAPSGTTPTERIRMTRLGAIDVGGSFPDDPGAGAVRAQIHIGPTKGIIDGSDAAAGNVGEYPTPVTFTNVSVNSGATVNVASISLTAGDWDVWAQVTAANASGGSTTSYGLTTTSGTVPSSTIGQGQTSTIPAAGNVGISSRFRFNLTATTTVFFVANSTTNVLNFTGGIFARRMR